MPHILKSILTAFFCVSSVTLETSKCHNACHQTKAGKLNIHLVPHTHNDVGWLKSVDEYYYGANKFYDQRGVQYIIDSVISELLKNPDRRFVYVESSFFWRWWQDAELISKDLVKKLVSEGRLEFLSGGWCMSDEATPHYSALIDQMTFGLKFLNETFGECGRPTAAWQIDPFGHSAEIALQFADMGFNGLFLGRIDYEDKLVRKATQTMEFVWRPDGTLGPEGDLFTSVMHQIYSPPPGFCFDTYCNDDPIMDNERLHGYNVNEMVKKFEETMQEYQRAYQTNHILITMGDDFHYTSAPSWYVNIDKLIKYTNNASKFLHLLYSTPACYLKAINTQKSAWPVKESDDFFPYGSDNHSYWTGYFTSRATFKHLVYLANNILQGTKQLATWIGEELETEEFDFKSALGIVQHHDSVSGTEKQLVTEDYKLYLSEGFAAAEKIISQAYKKIYGTQYPEQVLGNLRNESKLSISEQESSFVVTVYNQLASIKSFVVRIPVPNNKYKLYHQEGFLIEHDYMPIPDGIRTLPGRQSIITHDLVFLAENLLPLGPTNFYIHKISNPNEDKLKYPKNENQLSVYDLHKINSVHSDAVAFNSETFKYSNAYNATSSSFLILDNGKVKLLFNKTNGLLVTVVKNHTSYPFRQNFFYYTSYKGYNVRPSGRSSGAYIFRPDDHGRLHTISDNATLTQYVGKNVYEVHQRFNSWVSQVIRLYSNSEDIEFEWLVGPIPIEYFTGKEIVTKYFTNVDSKSTFYTDSNGRRWMERKRNRRKYWNTTITEPESSNYYPVTTAVCLKDKQTRVTVIVDRPEGCTSLKNGEIEIMLHRRTLFDDGLGVSEALDETAFGTGLVVRGTHTVQIMTDTIQAAEAHRLKTVEIIYRPVITFGRTNVEVNQWISNYNNKSISLLSTALPSNIHILTLERWRKNEILVRFEHIFNYNESNIYSRPVFIKIQNIFSKFEVLKYEELSLAANMKRSEVNRLKWNYKMEINNLPKMEYFGDQIIMYPMQIRTFLLHVTKKSS